MKRFTATLSATLQRRHSSTWQSLSQPEKAKFLAFGTRSALPIDSNDIFLSALTHTSYAPASDIQFSRLQQLGEKALHLYAFEHVLFKYPKLPSDAAESVVKSYIGMGALSDVSDVFGLKGVMRWNPIVDSAGRTGERAISARVLQALIGALYSSMGPKAARNFIKMHVLSRAVDVNVHLNLKNPKQKLFAITEKLKRKRPVARLLKETGRLSASSVFLVGIYSGLDKLGEGYGSSLEMAEERAAKDALTNYFVKELEDFKVPSDDEISDISFFESEEKATNQQ